MTPLQRLVLSSLWLLLTLGFCLTLAFAGQVVGHAAHYPPGAATVVDGDTVKFPDGRVCRLVGLDAPESDQPLGAYATAVLRRLVTGEVAVLVYGQDRYRRDLCWLTNGAVSVNAELVRKGAAETYLLNRTPFAAVLRAVEAEAKAADRGVWGLPNRESPSDYRKQQRSRVPP